MKKKVGKIINKKFLSPHRSLQINIQDKKDIQLASIRQAFADALLDLARRNSNLYVVSMDLKSSVALTKFAQKYPSRFIECGVAENNGAGVAAGLSRAGKTVFLVTYACFSPGVNWATIKQSICYSGSNVKIIGSHGGLLTGELGATHQMLEDIALMRSMPTMEVFSPLDANECHKIIQNIAYSPHPCYVRLVRPNTPLVYPDRLDFTIGKSLVLKKGSDITVLGHGPALAQIFSLKVDGCSLEVVNCSSIKPLDSKTILKSVKKTGRCLVIEDHQKSGGLGEAVASLILEAGICPKFIHLAVDNQFGQSAHDPWQLYDHYNLGPSAIASAIKKLIKL